MKKHTGYQPTSGLDPTNPPRGKAPDPPAIPTVGRIVHYVAYGTPGGEYKPEHRAAIVTYCDDPAGQIVSLCVLNPTGVFFNTDVQMDGRPSPVGGSWHWPER
jgi:hypothetical protein